MSASSYFSFSDAPILTVLSGLALESGTILIAPSGFGVLVVLITFLGGSAVAGVQTVRSGNGNFLLEHCISPTYRFSVVELKSSLAVRL